MSMNKYMHPRNIYKTPPNFKQLAIEYPEFRKQCTQDITGKVTIDFKDVNALRALSITLLKKDFQLDILIPTNKLIPTVPLRLNYLLWIEDLLSISTSNTSFATIQNESSPQKADFSSKIYGLDIGTGAACVYPLMAAKKYGWKMLATEIADDSIQSAIENVARNELQEKIEVRKVVDETLLTQTLKDEETFDFCMCNPPFFSSSQELNPAYKARNINRPRPRNAFCANVEEVVAHGGEEEFISRMIQESKKLGEKIRIYTTMIGHKKSILPLKKLLRECDVVSFKQTEFCQGHTTRWGLAWTFCNIDLRKVPEATVTAARKEKNRVPVCYQLPTKPEASLEEINSKIIEMLQNLLVDYEILRHSKNVIGYNIKAESNTWSHQRRKRREQKRRASVLNDNGMNCEDNNNSSRSADSPLKEKGRNEKHLITPEKTANLLEKKSITVEQSIMEKESSLENQLVIKQNPHINEVQSSNGIQLNNTAELMTIEEKTSAVIEDEEMKGSETKIPTQDFEKTVNLFAELDVAEGSSKRHLDEDITEYYCAKKFKVGSPPPKESLLEAIICLRSEKGKFNLEMSWTAGHGGKDALHQVMQYFKNNLKL